MANPKLPAHWRRNAYQRDLVKNDPEYLRQISPNLPVAVNRGWEIVLHVSTQTKPFGSGLTVGFSLEIFANGTLVLVIPCYSLDHAIETAEIFAETIPNSFIVLPGQSAPAPEFDLTSADHILETAPNELEWHVPGLIPAGLPTLLFGDGGTGKSLAALQLAVATAAGRPWFGHDVRPGPVIFMTAEDDQDEVHRRMEAMCRNQSVSRTDLRDLQINAKVGEDALLGIFNPETRLVEPTPLYGALDRAVKRTNPALLVVDTLADVFGGDENVRIQARQFIGFLRRLSLHCGTTVLCLAHPSVAGLQSGTGTSGSTGWSNSVRSRLYLERVYKQLGKNEARRLIEPDPDVRLLTTKKSNYGPVGGSQRLRWADGVLQVEAAPLLLTTASNPTAAAEKVDEKFLELLAAHRVEGRNVSDAGPTYAPSKFSKDERAEGIKKAAFAASMRRLFASGQIVMATYGRDYKRIEEVGS